MCSAWWGYVFNGLQGNLGGMKKIKCCRMQHSEALGARDSGPPPPYDIIGSSVRKAEGGGQKRGEEEAEMTRWGGGESRERRGEIGEGEGETERP